MSLIACTSLCVYQRDGYCCLDRAVSCGIPTKQDPCVNFVPRLQDSRQRFPNISDRNQLQPLRSDHLTAAPGGDQTFGEA